MKKNRLALAGLGIIACLLLVAIGILWLANAPIMPPTQTVTQALPDDRIPH